MQILKPHLDSIFLLACCFQFLVAAAQRTPAFLPLGNSFRRDVGEDRFILQTETTNPSFSCGFNWSGSFYYFSIIIHADEKISSPSDIQVVWTANRDKPLAESSTLSLAHDGNLELVDGDGSVVWSTGTSGKPVTAMKLEETGNLVLLDAENNTLWQSFDHPTDTLVAFQNLQSNQTLTSSANPARASYFVLADDGDLKVFIDAKPPHMYLQLKDFRKVLTGCGNYSASNGTIYEKLLSFTRRDCNGTPRFLITASLLGRKIQINKSPNHFLKLESEGLLKVYDWNPDLGFWVSVEFTTNNSVECLYTLTCGPFSVCRDGQCSCLDLPDSETQYFRYLNDQLPNQGCVEANPVFCHETKNRSLVDFGNYSYFPYPDPNAKAHKQISLDACHEACLNNCSCKAVFFSSGKKDNTRGNCYLLDHVFLFTTELLREQRYISRAFLKVPNLPLVGGEEDRKHEDARLVVGVAVGSSAVAFFVGGIIVFFLVTRKREDEEDEEEDELVQVPGMVPRRFSYEELKTATEDFQTILGQGGFGPVFGGVLNNGMRIAVKRLDSIGQGMKEFVAEVQTIGSIHHMNLARLVGFCARKSHRLLVYEFMPNGSLDKWIFHKNRNPNLDWKTRRNIIIGISKGLCYLHEDCSQRIAHLDIKPPNILLDENYNAKISDFGLSKLISRDESQVMTTMRGTPGYLAPEWLSSNISEKADVYSFGVVVMEVVCGRRNFDLSQPEGSRHLLKLVQSFAQENQLMYLVDMADEERPCYQEEAVRVMRIAMWCLQNDYTRRPLMSWVVKALEGTMEPDDHIEFSPFYAMEPRPVSQTQSGSEIQNETQSFLRSVPR